MTLAPVRPEAQPVGGPGQVLLRATPYLALDVNRAVRQYSIIADAFGAGTVHYAVKANPHPHLVGELVRAGGRFDVASPAELDLCLQAGADASQVIYSHPMKRRADIDHAYRHGVGLFAADSAAEIDKLAEAAPGAAVLVRLATTGAGSDWPLSGKFGCADAEVVPLLQARVSARAPARGSDVPRRFPAVRSGCLGRAHPSGSRNLRRVAGCRPAPLAPGPRRWPAGRARGRTPRTGRVPRSHLQLAA